MTQFSSLPSRSLFGMLTIFLASLFVSQANAQSVSVTHCNGQCPVYLSAASSRNSRTVIHHVYAAGINDQSNLADWVAYRLTGDAVGVASLLSRTWQSDRLMELTANLEIIETPESQISLASISVQENPYAGMQEPPSQQEDRARLAPITAFANTPYWSDLNNLSNMVPMPRELRLGPWLRLEQSLNGLAQRQSELNVIAGPLFLITSQLDSSAAALDINPSAYFKIVTRGDEAVAFVFREDLSQHASICEQQIDVTDIEQMSGLSFYPDKQVIASKQLAADIGCAN